MPGQAFKTPKIVQPSGRGPLFVLLLLVAAAWFAYHYGQRGAGYLAEESGAHTRELEQRLQTLDAECEQQRELAARYQRARQIDRAAVEQVQQELTALQQERADLQQRVAFLQSLISGKVTRLQVSQLELAREGKSNTYRFSFLVSKRDKGDAKISGKVELALAGKMKGKDHLLKAKELGLAEPLKMGFKHFQKIEGKLILPEGFEPRELVISARPSGRKFKPVEQRLKWQLG